MVEKLRRAVFLLANVLMFGGMSVATVGGVVYAWDRHLGTTLLESGAISAVIGIIWFAIWSLIPLFE